MSARENLGVDIWEVIPDEDAEALIDAYRAEVLAEAELLPKADVVAWLTKKAREDTPVWELASKVERGAVRPNNLRMLPPDFFQPGRTYTRRDGTPFQCITVTTTPWNGRRLAIGWHTDAADITSISWRGVDQWRHEYGGGEAPTGGDR